MIGLVFGADHKPHVEELPEPTPEPDEVLLQVHFCGICGSDLHAAPPDFQVGITMGHEFAGEVVAVGRAVQGWSVGDRACVNPNGDWCGRCWACQHGMHNMCPHIWPTVIGLARNGGMAPLTAVRAHLLHRLPEEVSTKHGAWVEPLAVALRTVRRSGLAVGDPAIVFGAGPIGLLVTTLLRGAGATEITCVEPNKARASAAIAAGADHVLDPSQTPVEQHFADPIAAPGHAFECTGVADVLRTAVKVLRPRGRLTVTGFARKAPFFDAADLLFKEIDIRGSFIYDDEFPAAIDLLARRKIDVDALTTGVLDVSQGPQAFEQMLTSADTIKMLLSSR
jgi:2-desacetyl-2-hydroxyethyl bacteriochlorophyllide A dehydrogenase